MHVTSATGVEADLVLDFDMILAYEAEHPDWSLIGEMQSVDKLRFSTLDLLAKMVGVEGGWRQFARDGFTMEQLSDAIMEGMRELGFTSPEKQSAE